MRKQLSKSEIRELNQKISGFGIELNKKQKVEHIKEDIEGILVDGELWFFYIDGKITPSLKLLLKNPFLKNITIDMPAVPFIANGADIMRPGITYIDINIQKGEYVSIVDEKNQKPLAVGLALFSGAEMQEKDSGKVVKNIHYVGDEVWEFI